MDDLAATFAFAPIERLHHDRTQRIYDLVNPDTLDTAARFRPAMAYALAHHFLEAAEAAARTGDQMLFDWYRSPAASDVFRLHTPTTVGPQVILAPALSDLTRSPISDTRYYLIGPDTVPAAEHLRGMTTNAVDEGALAGFGDLLAAHAPVVCLLRRKNLGDTLASWTITRLPGSVFVDHISDASVLGRDLVHEAAHNWLNDALTACEIKISAEHQYFSPWKNSPRPALGFLHACWAFPLVMLYTARAAARAHGPVRDFLTTYLDHQRAMLAATHKDHAHAVALIADDDLRTRLVTVYQAARWV